MRTSEISPLLDTLTPEQVAAYLRRKGWRALDYPNPTLLVFGAPQDEDLSLVLPSRQEFSDYPAKLRDGIRLLSAVYNQEFQTIVHNVAHWDRDVFKIRLDSPSGEQLLPLHFASQIISKYRDFVAYAAATETEPRRFFAKLTGSGREFVDKCMFGHTFVGSFGITIECPLDLAPQLPLPGMPPPRPFRRAVTERIATGYSNTLTAVEKDDPDIIVRNHNVGFSGNMCELLSDIYELSEGRSVSHRMIWAPELSPPQHLVITEQPIGLDERAYRVLKAASDALQTVEEPNEDKIISGRITNLRSDMPPVHSEEYELATRTIVVLWEMEKQQPLKVHIALPLDQYLLACDAHKDGRKVRIFGKPRKIGKFWHLLEHHRFEVVV
jgi:hypothetical protein